MKRIASILLTAALVLSCTVVAFAAGSISVSTDKLSMESGSTATFTVTADNAAGRIDVYSTNPSVATVSTAKEWLDKNSVTITVTAMRGGTCQIVVNNTDIATYEEEVIDGQEIVNVTVEGGNTLLGDVNNDGKINQKDVARLRQYLADPVAYPLDALQNADVNNDGKINQKDVARLRQYLADPVAYPLG